MYANGKRKFPFVRVCRKNTRTHTHARTHTHTRISHQSQQLHTQPISIIFAQEMYSTSGPTAAYSVTHTRQRLIQANKIK